MFNPAIYSRIDQKFNGARILTREFLEPEKKDNRVKPVDDQKLMLSVLAAMVVRSAGVNDERITCLA